MTPILLFLALDCGPCEPVAAHLSPREDVQVVLLEQRPDLFTKHDVRGVPTIVVGGDRLIGNQTRETIERFLNKNQ